MDLLLPVKLPLVLVMQKSVPQKVICSVPDLLFTLPSRLCCLALQTLANRVLAIKSLDILWTRVCMLEEKDILKLG